MKSSDFRAITASPLNGAPAGDALIRAHTTPAEQFFVRNHGAPPPPVPGAEWTIRVHGMVDQPLELHLSSVRDDARYSVEASLQCAGNRRTALARVRPIPNEVPWDNSAIGNATWAGLRLADILARAGVRKGAAHVWFSGADILSGKHAGEQFGASIPLEKALHPSTLIADTMNGAPLGEAHGAPVRAIVPGFIGARSVKWLNDIRVEREPTPNYFQRAYSVYPSSMLAIPADVSLGRVLGEFPVSSAFGAPVDGASVPAGAVRVKGWCVTGGDRTVTRVEVSADGGATWSDARFLSPAQRYVWRLWEADLPLARGKHQLVCRAFDDAGNTQPDDPQTTWNVKGYANNCWDRISVTCV